MIVSSPIIHQRRILGALRFRDVVTGETVRTPLTMRHERLTFTRNRSGIFAISYISPKGGREKRLAEHLDAFEKAPNQPPVGAALFTLGVSDPARRYLPRAVQIGLPRGDDWDTPIQADLYPAAIAPVEANWSGIRASLTHGPLSQRTSLAGARVRLVRDSDDAVLGTGYSDQRGEALVIALGIPVVDFSVAPSNGTAQGVGAKTVTARIDITRSQGEAWPPDPDKIETNGQAWVPVTGAMPKPELRTGRLETANLALHLKPSP